MYSSEQLAMLMLVAGADDPVATARQVRARWVYILAVAQGRLIDTALPQVMRDPQAYIARATEVLGALDEWLGEHSPRSA